MGKNWDAKTILGAAGFLLVFLLAFMTWAEGAILLFIIGLVVGFMNVSEKERSRFLIATIGVSVVGLVALTTALTAYSALDPVRLIALNLVAFAGAAALVVGASEIVGIARN